MSRLSLAIKPLKKPSPEGDPRYKRVMTQLKQGAAKTKAHPPASKKTADAARAAKGPPNERTAGGKARQVDKIKEAKEGKPEQSSFLAMLRAEIEKVMPKTLGQTENFDQTAQQMKGGLKGNVAQQKEKSTQDVSGASKQTPAPAGEAKAGGAVPPEGAPPAPNVDAASGMPAPKSDAEISQKDGPADVKDEFAQNDIKPENLPKAHDPRFDAAGAAAKEVTKNAETAPAKYRAAEQTALSATAAKAASASRVGAAQMVGARSGGNAKVLTRQQQQKAKDEAKRKEVVDKIESIYTATKGRVEAKLNALDGEVNGIFDRGVDAALNAMTNFVNAKIRDYKIRRYLTIPLLGLAAWIRDQALGLPDEVNAFYEQGRTLFQGLMDALIVRVANLVEQRLREAKGEVAKGQAEIKAYVGTLSPDLQKVGQQAQADVNNRFKELENSIEEKKNALAQSLAQKYKEGFDKANEALKAIQDSNKGLVAGFLEKLGEVIKALLEFKAKLMAILRKGADTIKLILADPLAFLGNLISAVKGGVSAFGANIWTHLKAGFMRWLLGNAPPGITIPSDFSPSSIFKLVLGVLGITYERMRAKAVKLLGPTAVTVIETLVKYVKALIEGGPAKLWEEVKSDLSNLKDMVIGAFQSWLITTVIQKAIIKIVSMFNPAGAIVQAVLAIVSIVQFVVEKAAQIAEFVSSVIDSIHAIATGSIGGAVKRIETALGNAVPLLIGFLASLIGLGGVAARIREFVMKAQAKVDAAIDKVLAKIVGVVKKLIGKLTGRGQAGGRGAAASPEVQQRWNAGIAELRAALRGGGPLKPTREVETTLARIKARHRFSALRLERAGATWRVHAAMNPTEDVSVDATDFDPNELTGQNLWVEIAARVNRREVPGQVKLSARSISYNRRALHNLIATHPTATAAAKSGARAGVLGALTAARAATDGDAIYERLRDAARVVNDLYAAQIVALPGRQLHVHHEERVSQNPATFERTRAGRIRARIARRIRNNVANLSAEERAIAARPAGQRAALIRVYAEQLLEQEVESGPARIAEVEMDVMSSDVHLGTVHARR